MSLLVGTYSEAQNHGGSMWWCETLQFMVDRKERGTRHITNAYYLQPGPPKVSKTSPSDTSTWEQSFDSVSPHSLLFFLKTLNGFSNYLHFSFRAVEFFCCWINQNGQATCTEMCVHAHVCVCVSVHISMHTSIAFFPVLSYYILFTCISQLSCVFLLLLLPIAHHLSFIPIPLPRHGLNSQYVAQADLELAIFLPKYWGYVPPHLICNLRHFSFIKNDQ